MKSYIILAAFAVATLGAGSALAQPVCAGNADCSGATTNNYDNTTNHNGGVGVGVGVGVGIGGAGGSSNVGNGVGNFSPSARVDNDIRNTNTNTNANANSNSNRNENRNTNQQQQQQQQEAEAKSASQSLAKSSNDGNKQEINFNQPGTVQYSGEYTVKSAPGFAIGGPASGPCNGFSGGAALSLIGGGGAVNFSKVDEGCEERETARIAALMGRMDIANLIIEESDVVKRAQAKRDARKNEKKAEAAPTPVAAAPAKPMLVAASTQITPSEQNAAICASAKRSGDMILANRLDCPK